jgi:hypothetical protein
VFIITKRNVNLHSKSTPGGLVFVAKDKVHTVPDDVADEPQIKLLKKSGHLTVLKSPKDTPIDLSTEKIEVAKPVDANAARVADQQDSDKETEEAEDTEAEKKE